MRFIHIADVHWRGLSRHEEYRESFENFFQQARSLNPDGIVVAGDIVHSKTQGISPELINNLIWWFTSMADICDVYVMLGNHDGLVLNKYREDAISPIINAINNPKIHLWKNSGVYPINDKFEFCVLSPFDTSNWDLQPSKNRTSICLYHGAIWGSHTDSDWMLEGDDKMSLLKKYDFSMLGDIHKQQKIDAEGRIWYCGSTIQQNYGETPNKGFLVWDINNRDDWNVRSCIIKHTRPFVTVDWSGSVSETIAQCKKHPNMSRFRIRSGRQLDPQISRRLSFDIKRELQATEVVYKIDGNVQDTSIIDAAAEITVEDLTSPNVHKRLLREYHTAEESEEFWQRADKIIDEVVPQCALNKQLSGKKWSISQMEYDNTFGYGTGNVINFSSLSGIVGLFGRNRAGKSSIPGTIMYGMYNTSDREIGSNLHIINTRKDYCSAKITFTVANKVYRLERQTTKHKPSKSKPLTTLTYLNLFEIDDEGNIVKDLTGEQRRDTETELKKLVGSSYDFLLTSFASQGSMNSFIREGATKRKQIISNFLGLDVFDALNSKLKEDSRDTNALLKKIRDTDWKDEIQKRTVVSRHLKTERENIEELIRTDREKLDDLKLLIGSKKQDTVYTTSDLLAKTRELANKNSEVADLRSRLSILKVDLPNLLEKSKKYEKIKVNFPIDELQDKLVLAEDLASSLVQMRHNLEKQIAILENYEKSINILETVPCGDKFPSCRFIKNSHANKDLYEEQQTLVDELKISVASLTEKLNNYDIPKLKERVKKYRAMLHADSQLSLKISELKSESSDLSIKINYLCENIEVLESEIDEIKINIDDTEDSHLKELTERAANLAKKIGEHDSKRLKIERAYGNLQAQIVKFEEDKSEYERLALQWKVYDVLVSATSWRGIPTYITTKQLPAINLELSQILQDVTGFTVDLEINDRTTGVYINYGDSRRPIECGSGMEKMISSLALRVALTNLSCLNKSDMLIIDEGFGALDATNLEAVANLLTKLKESYRLIMLISHVDAVKDVVDDIIDIRAEGMDSKVEHL